jgi:hypothetical protein
MPADFPARENFFFFDVCSTKCLAFLSFVSARYVEGTFRTDGIIKFHKQQQWAEDNHHHITQWFPNFFGSRRP